MALPLSTVDIERINASQYVSAVGLVILLWDHILTFPDEVRLIWRARLSIPKVLFLFNRYLVPVAMIIQTHEFSGTATNMSLTVCKAWYACAVSVGMLSLASSNFLILLRLWVLWDRCPQLMFGTLIFFIVTQLTAIGSVGYVIYEMLPTLVFNSMLRICVPSTKPQFVLLWSPGVAFESMVFLTTVWNALDRPRSRDLEMAKIMYRDGSVYFIGLFVLRLVNLILGAVAPVSLVFLGVFFVWCVTNVTLARLILNLRCLSGGVEAGHDDERDVGYGQDDGEGIDCTELPVLQMQMHQHCARVRDSLADSEYSLQHKVVL